MFKLPSLASLAVLVSIGSAHAYDWGKPKSPVIPQADGFFAIPNAAWTPQKSQVYRAIYDATRPAEKPDQILPALNMAGSELNLIAGLGVPLANAKFVVIFHGAGIDGILKDSAYRAKFGRANPNLPVLSAMRRNGVELFVCGQNVAFEGIDPATLSPDVKLASDALIVLMAYQSKGYALLSY